jgi:hypothetical protein
VHFKALPAIAALALRHLGDQEDLLEANRQGLQFAKPSPFSTNLPAIAPGTNQQLWFDQQEDADTPGGIFRPPVLISFTNTKCMIEQALDHA